MLYYKDHWTGWPCYKDIEDLEFSINRLGQSLEPCIDEVELTLQAIKANKQLMCYLRRRSKAYKRSVRNQQNPLRSKKCKHGRQQRTRRRK